MNRGGKPLLALDEDIDNDRSSYERGNGIQWNNASIAGKITEDVAKQCYCSPAEDGGWQKPCVVLSAKE